MKLIIVGGVAGGASAAARARRLDESAEILLIERGPDVSFANCGMPYFVGGEIASREKLLIVTPERLRTRFKLDVRTRTEVVAIDRSHKTVTLRQLATGEVVTESYDKLILATGAAPLRPPLPGLDLPGIHVLRNLEDMDRIRAVVDRGAKSAIVVGAGFIGLELAEQLIERGVTTTILDLNGQVLPPLDVEMSAPLQDELVARGVTVKLGNSVEAFATATHGLEVKLRSGETVTADLVVLGIGVRPENQLAVDARLPIGPRGGIQVNAQMQTADPDIYAVGDVVETRDFVTGTPTQIPLGGPANRQGRIAADHIFGLDSRYRGTQGTAIIRVFGKTAAITGHSEKVLQRMQCAYRKIYTHPAHHAGYFPGAESMTLKLLFDPQSGRILGAQGVGGAGVDKRIDLLAVAIQAGWTVHDLAEVELCYAPPYGSAKDPINMLGFLGSEVLRGAHRQITVEEWKDQPAGTLQIVDVRTPTEYADGHIPGAINIPVDDLRNRLSEISSERPCVVYCQVGQRGYLAQRILHQSGYSVQNLSGGYKTYLLYRLPVEK